VVIEQVIANEKVVFGDGVDLPADALERFDSVVAPTRLSETASRRSTLGARSSSLGLAASQTRQLEIRFTANSFVAPEKIRFKFKLEGHDADWREVDGQERRAFYTNLRSGKYTFRVTAGNNHGYWNGAGDSVAFSVAPYFYETWRFRLFCALGVVASAAGIQSYRLRWQQRVLRAEHVSGLEQQRTRIARDLHDDLGAQLTGLALRSELLRQQADPAASEPLAEIADAARSLAGRMGELVWALNPTCDTWRSFSSFVCEQVEAWAEQTAIACTVETPEPALDFIMRAESRHHLALVLREALNNVARHSAATRATVRVETSAEGITLIIRDGGRGFEPGAGVIKNTTGGNGLRNMRERIEELGGIFELETSPGGGTCVRAFVPQANLEISPSRNAK
jgi:signal transduction histidine kinase